MPGKPAKERDSYPGRKALNQHLNRHHDGAKVKGDLAQRLAHHDDLHWAWRNLPPQEVPGYHTHLPYQDGESYNEMAERMLAEGTAAHEQSE